MRDVPDREQGVGIDAIALLDGDGFVVVLVQKDGGFDRAFGQVVERGGGQAEIIAVAVQSQALGRAADFSDDRRALGARYSQAERGHEQERGAVEAT